MEYYIVLDYSLVNIVCDLCYKLLYLFVAVKNWPLTTVYIIWQLGSAPLEVVGSNLQGKPLNTSHSNKKGRWPEMNNKLSIHFL